MSALALLACAVAGIVSQAARRMVLQTQARHQAAALSTSHERASDVADAGVPPWFNTAMARLDITAEPLHAWAFLLIAGVTVASWAALAAPGLLVLAAAAAAMGAVAVRGARRFHRHRGYEAELLAAVAAMAAALGSGSSLAQALRRSAQLPGQCGGDLALVGTRIGAGWAAQAALDQWAKDATDPAVALVADALAVAGHAGASQSRALVAVADTIRDRGDRQREVRALASQARASCVVLVAIPLAFSAAVAATDHRVAHFLATTAAGWGCVIGGLALDGAGAWWMARLVRTAR
ncbi:MAG: type II secretion system F family protein [Acidimicrobiales bacterium]